jgi:hypothetical protein
MGVVVEQAQRPSEAEVGAEKGAVSPNRCTMLVLAVSRCGLAVVTLVADSLIAPARFDRALLCCAQVKRNSRSRSAVLHLLRRETGARMSDFERRAQVRKDDWTITPLLRSPPPSYLWLVLVLILWMCFPPLLPSRRSSGGPSTPPALASPGPRRASPRRPKLPRP